MQQLALEYGYVGLFVFSFVAATLITAPSDALAAAMPQLGYNPVHVLWVATLGGVLGNLINYAIGRYGYQAVMARFVGKKGKEKENDESSANAEQNDKADKWAQRAENLYTRYGVWTLLLSGLPFIGDPLTTVAGAFRVKLWVFIVLVLIGKIVKFVLLLGAVDGIANLF